MKGPYKHCRHQLKVMGAILCIVFTAGLFLTALALRPQVVASSALLATLALARGCRYHVLRVISAWRGQTLLNLRTPSWVGSVLQVISARKAHLQRRQVLERFEGKSALIFSMALRWGCLLNWFDRSVRTSGVPFMPFEHQGGFASGLLRRIPIHL